MSATSAPKPGVDYKVVLGDSLLEPPTNAANTYAILRYDFKPASVDRTRQGMVQVQQNKKQVMHSLPTINVAEPEIHYQGRFDAGNELDCVAIFDGKGGFRLERVLGQAYLRHTTKRTMKREPKSQVPQQHVNGSSPLVESAHTAADRKPPCRPEQASGDADAEAFDAELEAELERGLFEDADEQDEPVTMSALPQPAPSPAPPSADLPKQVPSIATTSAPHLTADALPDNTAAAEHSSSSESSDSSDSDDEASPKAGSPKAAVPPWTAAPEKAEPMNELEREFLGIPAPAAPAVEEPKPAEPHQSSDSSSDSSSSDSSSSDSSSSDSSDDEDIHKCSDDESEGKDIEWF